jgi:sulfate/thiosulfate transport system ATP-binding protein
MSITVHKLTKRFGVSAALEGVDLEVQSGDLVALLGPSGSGKTTLLRLIAGLEWPDEGTVCFDGQDASEWSARQRNVGFVFQHYALFRHMTVFENIAFGLRARPRHLRPSGPEIRAKVAQLLDLVQLGRLADRYPRQLSGGERQRVALARALAIEPRVLLLDEPFGALDAQVRKELRRWLRRLHDGLHVTSLFVTHDQEEALEVADHVVVLDAGRIVQTGTPQDVYEHPHNAFVHGFIGESICLPVAIQSGAVHFAGRPLDLASRGLPDGGAELFVRPDEVAIVPPSVAAPLAGTVTRVHGIGPARRVEVVVPEHQREHVIEIDAPRSQLVVPGQPVGLQPRDYRIYSSRSRPS